MAFPGVPDRKVNIYYHILYTMIGMCIATQVIPNSKCILCISHKYFTVKNFHGLPIFSILTFQQYTSVSLLWIGPCLHDRCLHRIFLIPFIFHQNVMTPGTPWTKLLRFSSLLILFPVQSLMYRILQSEWENPMPFHGLAPYVTLTSAGMFLIMHFCILDFMTFRLSTRAFTIRDTDVECMHIQTILHSTYIVTYTWNSVIIKKYIWLVYQHQLVSKCQVLLSNHRQFPVFTPRAGAYEVRPYIRIQLLFICHG